MAQPKRSNEVITLILANILFIPPFFGIGLAYTFMPPEDALGGFVFILGYLVFNFFVFVTSLVMLVNDTYLQKKAWFLSSLTACNVFVAIWAIVYFIGGKSNDLKPIHFLLGMLTILSWAIAFGFYFTFFGSPKRITVDK